MAKQEREFPFTASFCFPVFTGEGMKALEAAELVPRSPALGVPHAEQGQEIQRFSVLRNPNHPVKGGIQRIQAKARFGNRYKSRR